MNRAIKNTFVFIAGATIGSLISWKLLRTKYEKLAQDEIDSVKEVFSRRKIEQDKNVNESDVIENTETDEYNECIAKHNYTTYSDTDNKEIDKEDNTVSKPHVITPEEFGEYEDYERISLKYYSDGVLTDGDDVVIDNVDEVVGSDSLDHFGEYEDDSVYVRNDELKIEYEILYIQENYSDVLKRKPYLAED